MPRVRGDESKAADLGLPAEGGSVRIGDDDDTEALDRAMVGVDRVLLIAGTDPERRVQQHQNVIDAAARAGVGLIGFASRSLKDIQGSENSLTGDYFETEDRIRRSGLPHLLFRNALYLDTVPIYVGGARVFETGIRLPAGDGQVAYALRSEMGAALANAVVDHAGADHTYVVAEEPAGRDEFGPRDAARPPTGDPRRRAPSALRALTRGPGRIGGPARREVARPPLGGCFSCRRRRRPSPGASPGRR